MTDNEELLLDEDGIPVLTDIVRADDESGQADQRQANRLAEMAPREIADELLGNDAFRKNLEEVATSLTRNVCQQMEQALKPFLEDAITQALDDSNATSYEAIRQQLESSLPELVAKALQEPGDTPG